MSWFLPAVLFSQIVVLYWIGAPVSMRQLYHGFYARNPEWAATADHMAVLQRAQKRAIGIARLAGVGWLLMIGAVLMRDPQGNWPIPAMLASTLCWMALDVVVGAIEQQRIGRRIALPAKRSATFSPRTLGAFVHGAWIVVGLLLAAAMCGAYLVARYYGLIDDAMLQARLPVLVLGSAAWCVALWYAVHRKKQPFDDAYGPGFRRFDIHGTVATLYVFAAAAGFFVVRDLFGVYLLSDSLFVAMASLALQGFVLMAVARYRRAPLTQQRFHFNSEAESK